MDSQTFSDSSDESDLDYKPPGEEEILSEIDSDDQIEDNEESSTNTSTVKSRKMSVKRTKGKRGQKKKLKKIEINDETVEKTKEEVNDLLSSSEEDKKRLDALWEEFQRPVTKKSISNTPNTSENKFKLKEPIKVSAKSEITKNRNFEELFDNSVPSNKILNNDDNIAKEKSSESIKVGNTIIKKTSGGLANVLSQIGKKNKLTVLEKSKQDWDGYKKKEGIVEELVSYNKGKDGYLEKRDFLERTDLRQFELEKSMRAANRSRRN